MRWQGDEQSNNVEDVRGSGGGGGGGFGIGGGTVGIGTIVIALLGSWFFGVSPSTILSLLSGGSPAQVQQAPSHPTAPQTF
jgi:predicted metalloprotease